MPPRPPKPGADLGALLGLNLSLEPEGRDPRRTSPAPAGTPPVPGHDPALVVLAQLAPLFERLHRRFDTLDRHAADILFLQVSSQELVLGKRRDFSDRSRGMMLRAVAAEPYRGLCPCCTGTPVLDEGGLPLPGAEYDHAFHRALNRPEHGWLICRACHGELTHGGYLARFEALPAFRRFQVAVRAQRPRPQAGTRTQVRPPLPPALPGE